jgi:hypothetical protein
MSPSSLLETGVDENVETLKIGGGPSLGDANLTRAGFLQSIVF